MKEGFCCDRDREISNGGEVYIVDAIKTSDGGKGSYITYVIRLGVSLYTPWVAISELTICSSYTFRIYR